MANWGGARRGFVEVLRHVFRRFLCSSLGESAGEAVLFLLGRDFGRDPFEVLWDDPGAFYSALERIFGAGAKVIMNILIAGVNGECGLNMSPERFLELMRSGSVKEIQSLLREIAESYKGKEDDGKWV
ncbi:MAG: hypothetical protein QXN24_08620 [Candidatus Bathyarchaeia archaeon]